MLRALLVASLMFGAALPTQAGAEPESISGKKLRVVVFGAHPDDPESGGGLIAALTSAGHEVVGLSGPTASGTG
jgi:hypothetical protein